ncbi:MAG: succinate dehydrogenase iron-sulfur subunit [Candidatus Eisenbacteria bacterium]|nr:succinate dehydrogenase iron-sulfur subunit [Candidatus Eisenbacteria bacterium]
MKATTFKFAIERSDPKSDEAPRVQEYEVEVTEGMTVLEALLRIQAESDGSLAFRYACRGAVCGSCAMSINGEVALACRTQVNGLWTDVIKVGPVPNLPVLKDLVVDMGPFFEKDLAVEPWLQPDDPPPERERLVRSEELAEAEPYTNCISCASCHGVCPVPARDTEYLGPAALAKQYRFLADPRDAADEERLAVVSGEHGVSACDTVWRCVRVCPKGVPPTKGILAMREKMKAR